MGFFKDFKRDFAQAVNELMPESDSGKKSKNKNPAQTDAVIEDIPLSEEAVGQAVEDSHIEEITGSSETVKPASESGADAISEAVLREEAERLKEQLGKNIDIEAQRASEEIDSEIDRLPYEPEGWEEDSSEDDQSENAFEEGFEDNFGEAVEETAEEVTDEAVEEEASIDESSDEDEITDIQNDVDKLEAERVASEVAKAEEDRLIEEERLAAAARHAEEEAELKRLAVEEKKTRKKGRKDSTKDKKSKKDVTEEIKIREEDKMPDLETEISKNDAYSGLSEDTTYITGKTAIIGNIETEDDIDIMGRVEGNITCSGKLIIGGRVNGNIKVTELYAHQAHISGEIIAERSVKIGAGTISVGNISAESAVIAGAVKGDVDVKEQVIVDSSAVVVGNIRSKSIQVNSGAIVDGMCQQVYSDVNVEKLFDEEIESLDGDSSAAPEEIGDVTEISDSDSISSDDSTGLMEIEGLEPLTADE